VERETCVGPCGVKPGRSTARHVPSCRICCTRWLPRTYSSFMSTTRSHFFASLPAGGVFFRFRSADLFADSRPLPRIMNKKMNQCEGYGAERGCDAERRAAYYPCARGHTVCQWLQGAGSLNFLETSRKRTMGRVGRGYSGYVRMR
jgi:hypothetical protein